MKSEEQPLRVAIMGLGSYGNRVADAMKSCKRAKLVGAISSTSSKIEEWQKTYGIPKKNCYSNENFAQIKDNPDIDAVYVITPNAFHKENVFAVAKAGKHVICEKPLSINAADAKEMIDACEAAGVQLLVGYRMHFDPKTLEIIRQRKAGEFGEILFFQGLSGFVIDESSKARLDPKLSGGGALMDIGIYSVNGARYMIGEDPIWVTAQEVKNDPEKFKIGIDETITFQMGFPGGAVASCLSTYSMDNLDSFFLNGTKGFAQMQPATGYEPIMAETHEDEIEVPNVNHQTAQMDEMASIILDGKVPIIPVDGIEGWKDLKIIDAIYEAIKTGKKVSLS